MRIKHIIKGWRTDMVIRIIRHPRALRSECWYCTPHDLFS